MELRHLRYFVAAPEEFHLRRAAERLLVAQRSLSEQVRKLEPELGVRLFDRNHRSVSFTDAGDAMLDQARARGHPGRRRAARRPPGGRARDRPPRDRLPARRPPGHRPAAPTRFSALVSGDPRLARDRRGAPPARERPGEGRIDVAVTCLPAPVSGPRGLTIGEEGSVAAVPQDHPCANRAEIDLTWLERTALVQLSGAVNPAFYDGVLGACPRRRARLGPVIENAEPAVKPVLLAVDAGPGVALLPFEPGGNAVRRLADWIEDVRYHSRVPGQADVRASAARRRCSAGTRLVVELPLDPSRGS